MSTKKTPYRLLMNDRFWILAFSGLIALITLAWVLLLVPPGSLQIIRLQQAYGFFGLLYLYCALIITPLLKLWPHLKIKDSLFHARRALGVSAAGFSLGHVLISFFGQLGGFSGLGFLSGRYLFALSLGVIALLILLAMAVTSFDKVIDKMTFPRWKRLHQFVYIAGLAVLVHIVIIGTHYAYTASPITWITFAALFVILVLEALRLDQKLKNRFKLMRHIGAVTMILLHLLFLVAGVLIGRQGIAMPGVTNHESHMMGTGTSDHNASTYHTKGSE